MFKAVYQFSYLRRFSTEALKNTQRVKNNFWNSRTNTKNFFTELEKKIGIQNADGWYKVTSSVLIENGGRSILYHHGSLFNALKWIYPHIQWDPSKFERISFNFFSDPKNQKLFLEEAAKKLDLKNITDWKNVTTSQIMKIKGAKSLLHYYGGSLKKALISVYPEIVWTFSLRGQWEQIENQKLFLDRLAEDLSLKSEEDWEKVSIKTLKEKGGSRLLQFYDGSLRKALKAIYPSVNWKWKERTPNKYWNNIQNHRNFLEKYAQENGIQKMEDWYRVTVAELKNKGGDGILAHYGNSLQKMLIRVYPEQKWLIWMFQQVPKGFWDSEENCREFLEWTSLQLNIDSKNVDNWYKVSKMDIERLGGSGMIHRYGSLALVLEKLFPNFPWDFSKFDLQNKNQDYLLRSVLQITTK